MKLLHKKLLKTGENRYLVVVEHNGKDRLFFMDTHAQAVKDRGL